MRVMGNDGCYGQGCRRLLGLREWIRRGEIEWCDAVTVTIAMDRGGCKARHVSPLLDLRMSDSLTLVDPHAWHFPDSNSTRSFIHCQHYHPFTLTLVDPHAWHFPDSFLGGRPRPRTAPLRGRQGQCDCA